MADTTIPRRHVQRHPWRPARSRDQAVVGGVAAGLAHRMRLDPFLIRIAFLVLSLARGAGIFLYLAMWALSVPEDRSNVAPRSGARQIVGVACVTAALLLVFREAGWWLSDTVAWPLATAALGSTFVWARSDESERARWARSAGRARPWDSPAAIARLVVGFGLVIVATTAVLREYSGIGLTRVIVPVTVAVTGLLLAFGPWLLRLTKTLTEERAERIRSEERTAISAHLHDSVLQTLAMIQRTESRPEITALARRQERELREWLYGRSIANEETSLRRAIEVTATRVEERYRVPVETVIVGELRITDSLRDAVQATGEAMSNAARHSGADAITVYAEAERGAVTIFVRDEGKGFDPHTVPSDRRGIADSIIARVSRHGGSVDIRSDRNAGTEVKIVIPTKP